MKNLRGGIMLLIAAIIWGTAFVAQSKGAQLVEPFTYNSLRMFIGGIVLIPVIAIFKKTGIIPRRSRDEKKQILKTTFIAGICCGAVLFTASSLQQIAMKTTSAGKAGFITTLYIVLVPVIKLLIMREKTSLKVWLCLVLAVCGFFLLCVNEGFSIAYGDLLMLACAVFFALHIIVIDYFLRKNVEAVPMACIQFFVSGVMAAVMMLIFEHPNPENIWAAKGTILYMGLMSSGIAYTAQIIGQQYTEPTLATLIMSLESVFAALSGWVILGQALSVKELTGCVLVFAAVIFAQLKIPFFGKNKAA
ncbi:MAG: DMT family transporter [Clostridia bacterium]|nr:DMT family transporter [Clostridia bacterium]